MGGWRMLAAVAPDKLAELQYLQISIEIWDEPATKSSLSWL